MNGPATQYKSEYRNIIVRTTDGSTVRGRINLGIQERVSDLFTRSEKPFVVVTDASHRDGEGKVLVMNKTNIIWVEPED